MSYVRFGVISAFMITIVSIGGCAPWATYPPIDGAAQIGQPHFEPVPSVIAAAVRDTYENRMRRPVADGSFAGETEADRQIEYVFNLPAETPPRAWEMVQTRLGPSSRPMERAGELAVHISAVRVRALDSEVDVVYPRGDGHYQMVTLTLRQHIGARHVVTGSRMWRIRAEAPTPNFPFDGETPMGVVDVPTISDD